MIEGAWECSCGEDVNVPVVSAGHYEAAVQALRGLLDAADDVTQVRNGAAAEQWHRALEAARAVVGRQ